MTTTNGLTLVNILYRRFLTRLMIVIKSTLKELQAMIINLQANNDSCEVIIVDLQKGIKQVKKDIRWLKSRNDKGKSKAEDPNSPIIDSENEDLNDEIHEFATQDRSINPRRL